MGEDDFEYFIELCGWKSYVLFINNSLYWLYSDNNSNRIVNHFVMRSKKMLF